MKYSFDKYYSEDKNDYIDEEGVYWDDAERWLHGKVLNFCGCGSPENNLHFINNFIEIKEKKGLDYSSKVELYNNFIINHLEEVRQFIEYALDEKSILEHGSSICSGWINSENDFTKDLKMWCKENPLEV